MAAIKRERIFKLLEKAGVVRPRDLKAMGISGAYLNKLHSEGLLDRPSRGLYTLSGSDRSKQHERSGFEFDAWT